MRYSVRETKAFRKSVKRLARANPALATKLERIVHALSMGEPLPPAMRDHQLSGNMGSSRECHVAPDWLLIYQIDKNVLVLTLINTGSHSDLFG